MELDPKDVVDTARSAVEAPERASGRLNAVVGGTVAILATFMGICKVKDDNIVQAMQQAQADKLDHWAFYQARNLRQQLAEATVAQLELARASQAASQAAAYDAAMTLRHLAMSSRRYDVYSCGAPPAASIPSAA